MKTRFVLNSFLDFLKLMHIGLIRYNLEKCVYFPFTILIVEDEQFPTIIILKLSILTTDANVSVC